MVKTAPFVLPRPVDATQVGQLVEKCIQDEYRRERVRRQRTVDDEMREKVSSNLPAGEFSYTNCSAHETWKEIYFQKYGGIANPINQNYFCPHCHMEFGMWFPPEECPRCHHLTGFGQLVKDGVFKR